MGTTVGTTRHKAHLIRPNLYNEQSVFKVIIVLTDHITSSFVIESAE